MTRALRLAFGDIFSLLVITLIGFASHRELNITFLPRMSVMFFALALAWCVSAASVGAFNLEEASNPRRLWKPALAAVIAAPVAAVIRGVLQRSEIQPAFIIVLIATTAFGMTFWRGLYIFLNRKVL